MGNQTHFGEWGVIVQCTGNGTDIYWYKTKKEALIKYREKKKYYVLTFFIRQVMI